MHCATCHHSVNEHDFQIDDLTEEVISSDCFHAGCHCDMFLDHDDKDDEEDQPMRFFIEVDVCWRWWEVGVGVNAGTYGEWGIELSLGPIGLMIGWR